MKNICVIFRKNADAAFERGESAVLSAFSSNGYFFREMRIFLQTEQIDFREILNGLQKEYDTAVMIAENGVLPKIKAHVLEVSPSSKVVNEFGSLAIVLDGKTRICLLSCDDTGTEYAIAACIPFFEKIDGIKLDKIVVRSVGAAKTRVEGVLAEINRCSNGKMSYVHTRKFDEDVIELIYDSNTPKMLADDILRTLIDGLGDSVYALDNVTLEKQLVTLLKLRGKKLSVAESFTGGGIARRIVSVAGASEVYFEGLNTYDERSKIKRLGVSSYTLGSVGAVSDKTAYEMALGLLNTGDCDVAIATTGLAGPKSDKFGHPVGYCCLAVGTKERICVYQYKFDGNREEITEKAINYALFLAYKHLKDI